MQNKADRQPYFAFQNINYSAKNAPKQRTAPIAHLGNLVADLPAGTSFFTADLPSASWLSHSHLLCLRSKFQFHNDQEVAIIGIPCENARPQMQFFINSGDRNMIQCAECEFYSNEPDGRRVFRCDPFTNIKEPECLQKWQLLRLDLLVSSSQSMSLWQHRMAPMQEKLFKYVKRELYDIEETDS